MISNVISREAVSLLIERAAIYHDDIERSLLFLGETINGPELESVRRLAYANIKNLLSFLDETIGTNGHIHWFFWDNNCGKNGKSMLLHNGKLRQVNNLEDFLSAIGY